METGVVGGDGDRAAYDCGGICHVSLLFENQRRSNQPGDAIRVDGQSGFELFERMRVPARINQQESQLCMTLG